MRPDIGPALRGKPARTGLFASALFALAALLPALALFGFTVDDALIPARYAAHLARGLGYRFNPGGPSSDGVTPLGFAHLLAPLSGGETLRALAAAKVLGVAAWTASAAALGLAVSKVSERPIALASVLLVAASAPLAAWSAAGLETGLVTALVTFGVVLRASERERAGSLLIGLGAAWRPELLPFALTVALLSGGRPGVAPLALRGALAAAPFAGVSLVRALVWGTVAPLSVIAKPPDAELGWSYAAACFLLTGPIALLSLRGPSRLPPFARGLFVAVFVHFLAVALAGGDWMPLSRLVVPVLPASALVAAHLLVLSVPWIAVARLAVAVAGEVFAWTRVGVAASHVQADRQEIIDTLGPVLREGKVIASLDVGWVGAAAPDATLVDLAGVTDRAIAALPGGHTSKRIPMTLLDARGVDTLVLLLAEGESPRERWTTTRFQRGVEGWLALEPGIGDTFALVATGAPGPTRYVVLRRVEARSARRD